MPTFEDDTSAGLTFGTDPGPSSSETSIFFSSSFNDKTISDFTSLRSMESGGKPLSESTEFSVLNDEFSGSFNLYDFEGSHFEPSDYGERPEVTPPILNEDVVYYYIGVMTDTEAARFVTKAQSFHLYHAWDPEIETEELPLMFMYRSLDGACYNIGVKMDDNSKYFIEKKLFSSLTQLVAYYSEKSQFESTQDLFYLD